jgi:hypothetical protein
MSLPLDYVAFITAFATSVITEYLVHDFLHGFSSHSELWIAAFIIISLYLLIFLQARNYLYNEKYKRSLYWKWRQDFIQFLYSIVLFTVMRFFFQTIVFQLQATDMEFNDYMNFANFGVFFIFVFVRKLQSVLTPGAVAAVQKEVRQELIEEAKKDT